MVARKSSSSSSRRCAVLFVLGFASLLFLAETCRCFVAVQQLSSHHRHRPRCRRRSSSFRVDDVAGVRVVVETRRPSTASTSTTLLRSDKFNRDINERSYQKSAGQNNAGSAVAGAVLGGLLGGPFGMMFGASIGNNLGAKNSFDQARKQEMERMGITQDMLNAAEDVGRALEQSATGLEATKESLRSQQSLARIIDRDVNELYEKAKKAMVDGREEDAKKCLLERNENQESLKKVLKLCAEEKSRIEVMEKNVSELKKRALNVEAMLQRAVGAKARQDSSFAAANADFALSPEDPLLEKFKSMGID